MRTPIPMPTSPVEPTSALLRVLTWLSPAFPVGAYSYSHGLEWAVDAGLVTNGDALRLWIEDVLARGAGRNDAILLGAAHRAEVEQDDAALNEVAAWGEAFRGTAELALESTAQGRAFLTAVRAAWPHPRLDHFVQRLAGDDRAPAYPVVVGVACACFGIDVATARLAYLQALAANLVSAGVKLIPLGQTEGLRVLAALEATVLDVCATTAETGLAELGTATWRVDIGSACHETQYTRLFRS